MIHERVKNVVYLVQEIKPNDKKVVGVRHSPVEGIFLIRNLSKKYKEGAGPEGEVHVRFRITSVNMESDVMEIMDDYILRIVNGKDTLIEVWK